MLGTIIWILGAINSLNLIDGADGWAGSIGTIFSITLGLIALINHHYVDAVIAFAIAGALLGFLRYNFPPASIYLGDAGSMVIGLVLGTLALRCSIKQAATVAFAAPLALWAIPLFDSAAAVMRRKLTGRSIYATDRGHIHHRLLTSGLSSTGVLTFIIVLCIITSFGVLGGRLLRQWHDRYRNGHGGAGRPGRYPNFRAQRIVVDQYPVTGPGPVFRPHGRRFRTVGQFLVAAVAGLVAVGKTLVFSARIGRPLSARLDPPECDAAALARGFLRRLEAEGENTSTPFTCGRSIFR